MCSERELLYVPFFGWAMGRLDMIHIDRSKRAQAWNKVAAQGKRLAAGHLGHHVPGRHTHRARPAWQLQERRLAPGHRHRRASHRAHRRQLGHLLAGAEFLLRPGTITIAIGAPIASTGREPEELMREVETWIEAADAAPGPEASGLTRRRRHARTQPAERSPAARYRGVALWIQRHAASSPVHPAVVLVRRRAGGRFAAALSPAAAGSFRRRRPRAAAQAVPALPAKPVAQAGPEPATTSATQPAAPALPAAPAGLLRHPRAQPRDQLRRARVAYVFRRASRRSIGFTVGQRRPGPSARRVGWVCAEVEAVLRDRASLDIAQAARTGRTRPACSTPRAWSGWTARSCPTWVKS